MSPHPKNDLSVWLWQHQDQQMVSKQEFQLYKSSKKNTPDFKIRQLKDYLKKNSNKK